MIHTKTKLAFSVVVLSMLACNALFPSAPVSEAKRLSPDELPTSSAPLTEAKLPRVTVEDAKAAFDNETAIFVDVRSAQAYKASHIPGSINIQLGEFETDPTGIDLPRDHWIITYCT